jgi:predicted tellurium resistance membrane protein TerC
MLDPSPFFALAEALPAAAPAAEGAAGNAWSLQAILTPENLLALATLTLMEIVLGIDNIVFIAILVARLPKEQQARARTVGLSLAMLTRIALLFTITWIMSLTKVSLFTLPILSHDVNARDLVLLLGGLFLIFKATTEIHAKVEGHHEDRKASGPARFAPIIAQILLIDIVFSLDSVITAVGMARSIPVMVIAVVISVGVMLALAGRIASFIDKHPTVKMLALSFLLLIGLVLVADGLGTHVQKGYIYFAMAFSLGVEGLNMLMRRKFRATPTPH